MEHSSESKVLVGSRVNALNAASTAPEMTGGIDLSLILFSAKIDYVTLETTGKCQLPRLNGKPKWVRSKHFKALTVQDPSPDDIEALRRVLGQAPILELEVAVDLRPRPIVLGDHRMAMLETIMVSLFAAGLDPSRGKCMNNQFRAFYRRLDRGYIVRPFNMRLPIASDQQLHGLRVDDCQVKAYLKRTDHRVALDPKDYVARVEVRMCDAGLTFHRLAILDDLISFKFRSSLMAYFTHVKGTKRRHPRGVLPDQYLIPANQWRDKEDRLLMEKSGVGAFQNGGKGDRDAVRLIRNSEVNDRIGQALHRLQSKFRQLKSVCLPIEVPDLKSYLARPASGFAGSRMTI
jgi:hypothetical protein